MDFTTSGLSAGPSKDMLLIYDMHIFGSKFNGNKSHLVLMLVCKLVNMQLRACSSAFSGYMLRHLSHYSSHSLAAFYITCLHSCTSIHYTYCVVRLSRHWHLCFVHGHCCFAPEVTFFPFFFYCFFLG